MRNLFSSPFKKMLRCALAPREEFVAHTEVLFLAAAEKLFDAKPTLVTAHAFWTVPKYATAFATIFVGIGGLSFYAHRSDVAVGNTLYPLKRGYESVRLVSIPQEKRPTYHAYFANRRVHELASVAANNPSAETVKTLAADAQYEIQQVFAALPDAKSQHITAQSELSVEQTDTARTAPHNLCDSISPIFRTQPQTVITLVASNTELETEFAEKCAVGF